MDIFKHDGPVMAFLNTVTDLMILDLLCLVCCIPIVTIGPALCAKYAVAMRIVRREEPTIVKPFFKAFKENFKQALIAWLILMVVILLVWIDWSWMIDKGFDNVSPAYFGAAMFISIIVSFIVMTIFPIISRFELTVKEAFKTAALFSMLYFFGLLAIVILIGFSIFACIKYMQWLPLIVALGHISIVYCLCLIFVRGFKKLEDKFVDVEDGENGEDEAKVMNLGEEKTDISEKREE
ncbi:MAG: DUF624 domain-containing protein [Clostridiales bacterium]|nr:DUF624 domain-containing protein [Clostridiales bacterium]